MPITRNNAAMPSRPSSDNITTYNALPPPKRQQTFPARRKSVKAKAAIPGLRKDQSTLTQMQFVPSTSRSDIVDMSTDDEFEDSRPKKRRRKTKFGNKDVGQSTLTQLDRSFSARRAQAEFELDEDGFQIWEDSDTGTPSVQTSKRLNENQPESELLEGPTEAEIPETSQIEAVDAADTSDQLQHKAATLKNLLTPRKVQFKEVPSSQTPPSTAESLRNVSDAHDADRSPLKQKSVNAQPPTVQLSPESQNISMKMLERVRFKISAIAKAQSENRPPLLTRMSTIQDSQSEGASLSNVSSKESLNPPPRKGELRRVTTVQDSQFDDEDLFDDHEVHIKESQYAPDFTQQDYFDPANSALDRDALRFRWTQTQKQLSNINEDDSDAETDDGDLDGGRRDLQTPRVKPASPNLPTERRQTVVSDEEGQTHNTPPTAVRHKAVLEAPRPSSGDDSAYDSNDHANNEETLVLSSSPPLRASQVSTIVPTQASTHQTATGNDSIASVPRRSELIEPATVPISPYRPIRHFHPLSSSPFPLPPWSSPQKPQSHAQLDETSSPLRSSQQSRLVDYSLPPPPTLSSSSRQTPTSSSL